MTGHSGGRRTAAALLADTVAIFLNSGALALADVVSIETARGGLLRLINQTLRGVLVLPQGPYRSILVPHRSWAVDGALLRLRA